MFHPASLFNSVTQGNSLMGAAVGGQQIIIMINHPSLRTILVPNFHPSTPIDVHFAWRDRTRFGLIFRANEWGKTRFSLGNMLRASMIGGAK